MAMWPISDHILKRGSDGEAEIGQQRIERPIRRMWCIFASSLRYKIGGRVKNFSLGQEGLAEMGILVQRDDPLNYRCRIILKGADHVRNGSAHAAGNGQGQTYGR